MIELLRFSDGSHEDGALLLAPLETREGVIGVMTVIRLEIDLPFTRNHLNLLSTFAAQAASAIENARLFQNEQKRLEEIRAFFRLSQELNKTLELEKTLQLIVDFARTLIPNVERSVIHLFDRDKKLLNAVAVAGIVKPSYPKTNMQPGEGIAGIVMKEGRTINITKVQGDERFMGAENIDHIRSILVAPIQSKSHRLGTISVTSAEDNAFSSDDERLLTTFGGQAAVAIESARLYTELGEALENEKMARAQLVQSEKLAAMGRMTASVAHEMNNPLQAISAALYLVNREETLSSQSQQDLQVAIDETNRMAKLISRLRDTYRPTTSDVFEYSSINDLVVETEALLHTHFRQNHVEMQFEPNSDLPLVFMNRDHIKQVLLNLIFNSIEAMKDGGSLFVKTAYTSGENEVCLTLADTGPGIPSENLINIFDPFFTTKPGGTGLGLAISYDIIQRHKGRIEVNSQVGKGTTFEVRLPV